MSGSCPRWQPRRADCDGRLIPGLRAAVAWAKPAPCACTTCPFLSACYSLPLAGRWTGRNSAVPVAPASAMPRALRSSGVTPTGLRGRWTSPARARPARSSSATKSSSLVTPACSPDAAASADAWGANHRAHDRPRPRRPWRSAAATAAPARWDRTLCFSLATPSHDLRQDGTVREQTCLRPRPDDERAFIFLEHGGPLDTGARRERIAVPHFRLHRLSGIGKEDRTRALLGRRRPDRAVAGLRRPKVRCRAAADGHRRDGEHQRRRDDDEDDCDWAQRSF